MAEPLAPLAELGRTVARAQDEQLESLELSTKERLLEQPATRAQRRGARWAAVSLAAAVIIGVLFLLLQPESLTFTIGETAATGELDQQIAAPPDASVPLRFSDGTALILGPASRTRVTATNAGGAELLVERGRIEATVVPRTDSDWRLRFGPFEVVVTGTRFTADWNPETEQLAVELHEGLVLVRGPALGEGHPLAASNRLGVSAQSQRFTISSTPPSSSPSDAPAAPVVGPPTAAEEVGPSDVDDDSDLERDAGAHAVAEPTPAQSLPRWRRLHEAGKYREALQAAKQQGFEGLCAAAGAGELLLLADTARSGGDSRLAAHALTTLRARHAGSPQAAHAAFTLGTLAFDGGAYGQAAQWFTVHLTEQPGGTMAHAATVRLLEASSRAGDRAGARAAAKRYLATYPNGPHAERAKRIAADRPSTDR